jgi:hypothetical protein
MLICERPVLTPNRRVLVERHGSDAKRTGHEVPGTTLMTRTGPRRVSLHSLNVDRLHGPVRRYVADRSGRGDHRPVYEPHGRVAEVVPSQTIAHPAAIEIARQRDRPSRHIAEDFKTASPFISQIEVIWMTSA